jgi:hypothetical protein
VTVRAPPVNPIIIARIVEGRRAASSFTSRHEIGNGTFCHFLLWLATSISPCVYEGFIHFWRLLRLAIFGSKNQNSIEKEYRKTSKTPMKF